MRRTVLRVAIVAALSWVGAVSAGAAHEYEYVFGSDSYQVLPGGAIDVPVYLQETVNDGAMPVLATGGGGLLGAGVRLVFDDPPQPSQPAGVSSAYDIAANAAFDQVTRSVKGTSAGLSLFSLETPEVYGQPYSTGVYRLHLGTFHITAGLVPNESTPIRATDYSPRLDDLIAFDLTVLDGLLVSDARATITTVPEPGTFALLAAGGLGLLAGFWRRWFNNSPRPLGEGSGVRALVSPRPLAGEGPRSVVPGVRVPVSPRPLGEGQGVRASGIKSRRLRRSSRLSRRLDPSLRRARLEPLEDRRLLTISIGDLVWNDLNSNGRQDVGEPGVAGAVVELFSSTDDTSATPTTSPGASP